MINNTIAIVRLLTTFRKQLSTNDLKPSVDNDAPGRVSKGRRFLVDPGGRPSPVNHVSEREDPSRTDYFKETKNGGRGGPKRGKGANKVEGAK